MCICCFLCKSGLFYWFGGFCYVFVCLCIKLNSERSTASNRSFHKINKYRIMSVAVYVR